MKKLIIPVGMLFVSGFYQGQTTTPSSGENYIYSKIILDYDINNQVSKTSESIQYLDGLGRAKQVVNVKAAPSGKDLVTTIPYDGFGRSVDSWLPVPMSTLNGGIQSGVNSAGTSYYGDSTPFGHSNLESSPLDRVLSQVQPGLNWQGHAIQFGYDTNDGNEVYKFVTTTSFPNGATSSILKTSSDSDNSLSGLYKANKLYKNTVTDEDGNKTIEFKNGEGQVLLVRKVLSATDYADTYYVYNEYNLLAFVIPPKAVGLLKDSGLAEETIVDNPILSELCYQYRYDSRRRLVEKKLPGKEWEYMVYDKQDRLVMTQDANMGASKQWLFTKYDQYGRVTYTGIYTSGQNYGSPGRSVEQGNVDARGSNNTSRLSTVGFNTSNMDVYYDNGSGSYPNSITKLLSVNYYDTYPYYTFSPAFPSSILNETTLSDNSSSESRSTKSLPVVSLIKNIEDDNWTKSYTYYDNKGRSIGSYSTNHLGGRTEVYSKLNFSGGFEQSITKHKRLALDTDKVITENFTYDSQNRLLSHTHQVDGGSVEYLTQNKYNDLLQLESKKVGGTVAGAGLQQVDYQYNIRGWMTRINDPGNLGNDLFGYEMKYTNPVYSGVSSGKFNGNISEIDWKASTDNNLKRYNYQYDALNRLTGGIYSEPNTTVPQNNYYNETMSYDLNGNIMTLQRNRFLSNVGLQQMDNLSYAYGTGNRLNTITDTTLNFGGYPEVSGNVIHYDQNGNMTDHIDKGVLGISYNHLNLVDYVKFDRTYVPRFPDLNGNINVNTKYLYRADGAKLRKIYTYGSGRTSSEVSTITEYLDGFQYEVEDTGGRYMYLPKFVPTSEGYYNFENNKYIYHYTDHLGNIRLSYVNNGSGAEAIEENNYYPFGLKHGTGGTTGNPAYKYQYNGKEYQNETGWNDYGARMYMPDLGRWGVIDPLAEKSRRFTPYNYAMNNPMMFIDPDGREIIIWYNDGKKDQSIALKSLDDINKLKGIKNDYVQDMYKTLSYLSKESVIDEALTSDYKVNVYNPDNGKSDGENEFIQDGGKDDLKIAYNPRLATSLVNDDQAGLPIVNQKTNGKFQTPALGFLHEVGHFMGWTIDEGKTNLNLFGTPDPLYFNASERFVVEFYETPSAINLKESTRTNHLGKNFITTGPTSVNFVRNINNPKLNQAEMIKAEIEKNTKSR